MWGSYVRDKKYFLGSWDLLRTCCFSPVVRSPVMKSGLDASAGPVLGHLHSASFSIVAGGSWCPAIPSVCELPSFPEARACF